MNIIIEVSPEEYNIAKEKLHKSITNYEQWENGEEKLKYNLGNFTAENVMIKVIPNT